MEALRRKEPNEQEPKAECGVALLAEGKKPKEVAESWASQDARNRWEQESKHPRKKKATRPPGRPRKLSAKQVKQLEKALDNGAYAFGMLETTGRWIDCSVILANYLEFPETSAVWHVMQRMGLE